MIIAVRGRGRVYVRGWEIHGGGGFGSGGLSSVRLLLVIVIVVEGRRLVRLRM